MGGYGMKNYVKESSFSDELKLLGYKQCKKEFITKACEWLKIYAEDYHTYDAWKGDYIDIDALITDFKKKMEE